jgi:hypothetical protein
MGSFYKDLHDFYGKTLIAGTTDANYFIFSRDRAPFCPDKAWLSLDAKSC